MTRRKKVGQSPAVRIDSGGGFSANFLPQAGPGKIFGYTWQPKIWHLGVPSRFSLWLWEIAGFQKAFCKRLYRKLLFRTVPHLAQSHPGRPGFPGTAMELEWPVLHSVVLKFGVEHPYLERNNPN